MKVINPFFDNPVESFAEANAETVRQFLESKNSQAVVTFEEVRIQFPLVEDPQTGQAPMTDGTIAAIFQHLGYEVTE